MRFTLFLLSLSLAPALAWSQVTTETLEFLPADGAAADLLGTSVGVSGQIAIVGAHHDDDGGSQAGSAYLVDTLTGAQLFKLLANDGASGHQFGYSVACSGTTAIVGALGGNGTANGSGAAYLFDMTTGTQIAKLQASDGGNTHLFGWSVAISGTTAIVGAIGDATNGSSAGAAYLFDTGTGSQIAKLLPMDGAADDFFGWSVGIAGGTAIVGAYADDDAGNESGSAYLFDASSGAQLSKLVATDASAGDEFGFSVGIHSGVAIVGARADDDNGVASGSAYLFDALSGSQTFKLLASDGFDAAVFGTSVAISGSSAVVGANFASGTGTFSFSGSAYVFDRATGMETARLAAVDGLLLDWLGESVAIDGSNVVVGAPQHDHSGVDAGAAYVFDAGGSAGNSGSAFCFFGDGSNAICPCAGFGGIGEGCVNSGGSGASLLATGNAFFGSDTLQFFVSGVPGAKPGLLLRGNNQIASPVGDGILCTSGGSMRSQVQVTSAGQTTFTDFHGGPFGSVANNGTATNFQFWYRDPANTCTGQGFNFSNAWTVLYLP